MCLEEGSEDRFYGTTGGGGKVGLCGPQFVLATILDPSTFPGRHTMPDDWKDSCHDVLQIFYPEPERLIEAEIQLQKLVSNAENGAWSSDVDLFKEIRDKPNQTKLSSVINCQKQDISVEANWSASYG